MTKEKINRLNKKANDEKERIIARYDSECGECITYKATPDDFKHFDELEKKNKKGSLFI